jgi:hypothetical protein
MVVHLRSIPVNFHTASAASQTAKKSPTIAKPAWSIQPGPRWIDIVRGCSLPLRTLLPVSGEP